MAKDVITPYIKKNTSPQDPTREGAIRGDEAIPEEPEAPPVAAPAPRKTGSPEFNAAFGAARKAGDEVGAGHSHGAAHVRRRRRYGRGCG